MADRVENCGECAWADVRGKTINPLMQCTRFPKWHLVKADHFCGEFKPKDEGNRVVDSRENLKKGPR